ncbi:Cholesterol 7-alpha-monooxygenase [Liparis tanakae]|uniref:Cholesterol 7-alpha-monooxygenase n=1 Tax=Liparis tanakae TaxID=230148 RepID=A0A4Z2F5J7_9TELE|nr:Cholesterol 7-alpha-monooxygenase [Liparis tanakae]
MTLSGVHGQCYLKDFPVIVLWLTSCTELHRAAPSCIELHRAASSCTELHRAVTPAAPSCHSGCCRHTSCTELHRAVTPAAVATRAAQSCTELSLRLLNSRGTSRSFGTHLEPQFLTVISLIIIIIIIIINNNNSSISIMMISIALIWAVVVGFCCLLWLAVGVRHRRPGEPAVENGLIPYLGCALQFGANPLQFLRSRQKKYGHIFTCKIAGQFIHFLCDPFSYHAVIKQGRHLDWRKFHFATSVKVTAETPPPTVHTGAQAFGHDSFDPRHGHTTENLHQTFLKTLQGEALPSLIESMMGHLQDVMLRSDTLGQDHWEVDGIFAFCYKVSSETLAWGAIPVI